MPTNRDFQPLALCFQALDVLIASGEPNCIPLAEHAIDEFLQLQNDPNVRTGDLRILEQELDEVLRTAQGKSRQFIFLLGDYLAAKRKELNPEND